MQNYHTLEEIFYEELLVNGGTHQFRSELARLAAVTAREDFESMGADWLLGMLVEVANMRPDLAYEVVRFLREHPTLVN